MQAYSHLSALQTYPEHEPDLTRLARGERILLFDDLVDGILLAGNVITEVDSFTDAEVDRELRLKRRHSVDVDGCSAYLRDGFPWMDTLDVI